MESRAEHDLTRFERVSERFVAILRAGGQQDQDRWYARLGLWSADYGSRLRFWWRGLPLQRGEAEAREAKPITLRRQLSLPSAKGAIGIALHSQCNAFRWLANAFAKVKHRCTTELNNELLIQMNFMPPPLPLLSPQLPSKKRRLNLI